MPEAYDAEPASVPRSTWDDPTWYLACTMKERVASLAGAGADRQPFDPALADRELELWRAQPPFDRDGSFDRRLASEEIEPDALRRLLGEDATALASRMPERPAWLGELERAMTGKRGAGRALRWPDGLKGARTAGFLRLVEPLLRYGRNRLEAEVERRMAATGRRADAGSAPLVEDAGTVADLLFEDLPLQLHGIVSRALVLEVNVARLRGDLRAATPEARFDEFVERLSRPGVAASILADYPVLARQVHRAIARRVRFGAELVQHLSEDRDAIIDHFGVADPGTLVHVAGGAGDLHREGRSVLVLRFSSGRRLVYKPRSMAVDVHFQELLEWINDRGDLPPFRVVAVLDRGDHGWMEFVTPAPCESAEEVRRFYRRQGGFLAILHLLQATDFHFENLIASGEHPVLIDLETLFHASAPAPTIAQPDQRLVTTETSRSVLRIGLLPQKTWATDGYEGVDLSGLGGEAGQLSPDRMLQWEGTGTDRMQARRERVAMPGSDNQPQLGGEKLSPLDYDDDLARGFEDVYRLLMSHEDELDTRTGLLARFAGVETRCVLRSTRAYGLLLMESLHPDFQRDALELERHVDRLWVGVDENPWLTAAVPSERHDLLHGDIPLFTTRPGSRDLHDSRGRRLADFWSESGLERVQARLDTLCEDDLRRQVWFIRASLATLTLDREDLQWSSYEPVTDLPDSDAEELRGSELAAARRVADRLDECALKREGHVAWIGLAYVEKKWNLVPLPGDLYGGAYGVIHFLAHLGHVTGDAAYTDLAHGALTTLRERLKAEREVTRSVGAFNGWGGVLYSFAHWHALWGDEELLDEAFAIVDRLPGLIDADEAIDIVGGSAGCILGLIALHARRPDDRLADLARACGDRIVGTARPMERGVGWYTQIETDNPITGFSHGGSGMAWALLRLHAWCGDERYRDVARQALAFERAQFVESEGNWVTMGDPTSTGRPQRASEKALSMAWCYGAPGIGLARLEARRHFPGEGADEDLEAAVDATLRGGFGRNHCLCHGDLGNLDFLLQVARDLDDETLRQRIRTISAGVLVSIERDGFLCGVPLGVESPSLMNGLAGIGYGLLRLAAPDVIPSVLALDPPESGSAA